MRLPLGTSALVLTALLGRAAAAEEPPAVELAALSWPRLSGAASCPSGAEVTHAIEQRLGHAALVPKEQATLLIEARLQAASIGGFQVEIALIRGDTVVGRRELESADPSSKTVAR